MDLVELPDRPVTRHPWEEARFRFFHRVLEVGLNLNAVRTLLDVGAGDAWFASQLAARTGVRIVCWDTGYTPELLASRALRDRAGVQLVADRPHTSFDVLLLLDVLEHVADDHRLLGTLVRENLLPGGHALISVPAWPSLFSSHDVRLRHERRYTPAAARVLIRGAGLEIVRTAGLFHSLIVPRALDVLRERLTKRSAPPPDIGHWNGSPTVTRFVRWLLEADARLSLLQSRMPASLPGLSWWALCRKPDER
jgi:SAM-dependent methyltransferase